MATVTCHTPGCQNADVAIDLDLTFAAPESGQTVHVDAVICGPCGQPITDIDEKAPREDQA